MKKLISFFAFLFILIAANNLVAQEYYDKIYDTIPKHSIKTTVKTYREPIVSTALSLVIPGLGQFYNGQWLKGTAHFLWFYGSNTVMFYLFFANLQFSDNDKEPWDLIALAATSVLTSWVVSMVDANISSRKINKQLGLASIQLGKRTNLSFNPDIKLVNTSSSFNSNSLSPSYGLNIKLSF